MSSRMKADEVLSAALQLPPDERADIARELLDSLDEDGDADEGWEAAWTEQIAARLREVRDGRVGLVDGDEALARVRARLEPRPK